MDYMTYAYLQLARDDDAGKVLGDALTIDANLPAATGRTPSRQCRRVTRLAWCLGGGGELCPEPKQVSVHRGDDAFARAPAQRGAETPPPRKRTLSGSQGCATS